MLPGFSAPPQTAWKPSCGCLLSFRPSAPYLFGLWISVLCQEHKFPFDFDPTLVVKSEIFEAKSFGMNEWAFRTKSNQHILQDWGENKKLFIRVQVDQICGLLSSFPGENVL